VNTLRMFEDEWAALAPRLSMVLAAKGVHPQDRDDLLQETALRLYRVWETLAPDQPVWPFAVTIALNLWRDQLRAAVVRQRDVLAANLADSAAEASTTFDVERTVLARHELAQVGALMRELEPEQRRLLLANDEVAATVAPLRPAERMARMRARRELAKLVGRASAALALLWWRRPLRANAMATAACAGVLAATVMSGAPFVARQLPTSHPHPVPSQVAGQVSEPVFHLAAAVHRNGAANSSRARTAPTSEPGSGLATVPPTSVCATPGDGQPPGVNQPSGPKRGSPLISVDPYVLVYQDDGGGPQPLVETPAMSADDGGCVHVG
jgi:DNA-directed RNA polymerase specialized sigma24 family protein